MCQSKNIINCKSAEFRFLIAEVKVVNDIIIIIKLIMDKFVVNVKLKDMFILP